MEQPCQNLRGRIVNVRGGCGCGNVDVDVEVDVVMWIWMWNVDREMR